MASIRTLFDVRSGLFGAAIMSGLVWWINASHGAWPATTAAVKQAAYTFFFGGLIMRVLQRAGTVEGFDFAADHVGDIDSVGDHDRPRLRPSQLEGYAGAAPVHGPSSHPCASFVCDLCAAGRHALQPTAELGLPTS